MKTSSSVLSSARRAFTLVETLVVVSIIVLILAMTGPTLLRTMQANKLTSAGDSLLGFITEAQQLSATLNTPVEVRFYKYELAPAQFEAFHSYQMFKVTTPTAGTGSSVAFKELFAPLASPVRLPEGIIIPTDNELCPLLDGEGFPDQSDDNPTGNSGVPEASYVALRFMTDGSCRRVTSVAEQNDQLASLIFQPLNQSYFTIANDVGQEMTVSKLPKNFFTIQIDPFNSKARTYRPGQS